MPTLYSPHDLHALPSETPEWVVDNLLRTNRKRPSLLCGSPHSGKSTLAKQLAIAVTQGTTFLGRNTVQGKVIYWQSEEDRQDAKEDFFRSGMALDDSIVIVHPLPEEDHCAELNKVLDSNPDTKLVIIETLDDFLRVRDIKENTAAREAFERFDAQVVSKHCSHCSFLTLHHFKKSDKQKANLSLTQILGATFIAGRTDAKMFMHQISDEDPRRVFHAVVRKGAAIEPTYLDFDPETQTARLGMKVADEKARSKKAMKESESAELEAEIFRVLHAHRGRSKWDIVKLVGGNSERVGRRIDELAEGGHIVVTVGGKKGNAKCLYLTGEEPTVPSFDSLSVETQPEEAVA